VVKEREVKRTIVLVFRLVHRVVYRIDVVDNRVDVVDGRDNMVLHSLLRQVVVDASGTKTVLVGRTDLCGGFPATGTIGLVEAISADAYTGRQLEIGSVKAVFAHLFKVARLIKIYGYL
jgi:hypothetical protein